MTTSQDPRLATQIRQASAEARIQIAAGRQAAARAGTVLSRVSTECDALVAGSARRVDVLIRQSVVDAVRALADAEAAAATAEHALGSR